MTQTAPDAVLFLMVWLLFAATCLANKPPSASIELTLGPQTQHRHHTSNQDGIAEVAYGPLVPRINGAQNHSTALRRAPAGAPGQDTYGPLFTVPGCVYCPKQDMLLKTGRDLLASLDTATMQTFMRLRDDDSLNNKCVFYTASTTKPFPAYLSDVTSVWACSKRKLSVWVGNSRISVLNIPYLSFPRCPA